MSVRATDKFMAIDSRQDDRNQGSLTAASLAIYTTPTGQPSRVNSILLCETSGNATTVTLFLDKSGDVEATQPNMIFNALPLAANETRILDFGTYGMFMKSGDKITGKASVTARVNFYVSASSDRV